MAIEWLKRSTPILTTLVTDYQVVLTQHRAVMSIEVLSDYRKKSAYTILVGLAAFAVVATAAINDLPKSVEEDLRIEVQSLVASQDNEGLAVVVDGQDVAIGGKVEDEQTIKDIRKSLQTNDRIRQFELQLKLQNPDATNLFADSALAQSNASDSSGQQIASLATIEPELTILRIGKRLMINGSLPPNPLFEATVTDLSSVLQVNNSLTQSNDVKTPAWLETIVPVITTLPMISGANLELKDNSLILNGSVDSQTTLDGINARIANIDESTLVVHSNFWIVEPESPIENDAPLEEPIIKVNWADGKLKLSGTLSSDASLLKVRNVLMEHYKPSLTENTLQVSANVSEAPWLEEFVEMLPGLRALETAQVAVAQGKLTLSGESGNAEMPITNNQSQQHNEPIKINNEIVMLDVESVSTGLKLRKELDLIALDEILFKSNEAEISQNSFQVLEDLARSLKKYPDVPVIVAGHTDTSGPEQGNQTLSQQRANAVREDLIFKGVDKNRVSAVGYGESRPLATNDTPEGRARNRRIEINY